MNDTCIYTDTQLAANTHTHTQTHTLAQRGGGRVGYIAGEGKQQLLL